jgi:hypothetical protein
LPQSLIEQLQLGAVDGSSPITDLLRRAKLAAVKLSAAEFAAWIDLEMNGYEDHTSLPSYRRVSGVVKFHNPYHGWQPVLGLQGLARSVFQPIGELFMLAHGKSGFLTMSVPEEFRRKVCAGAGFQVDVQFHIPQTEIAGIVEAVRNNILEWTLKLEQAGIRGEGLSFTPEETKAAHSLFVTNNYHGPVASIAQGTNNTIQGVSQTNASATPQEIAEAVAALISAIRTTGKALGDAGEATSALAAAQPELKAGRVPFSKIAKAVELFGKSEDLAMKAPEVASRLHQLAQLFGWA